MSMRRIKAPVDRPVILAAFGIRNVLPSIDLIGDKEKT